MIRTTRHPETRVRALINFNRRLSGLHLKHQNVGDAVWPYLEGGTGTPVVLLHGFGADKDRFGTLATYLKSCYHVVIPDLPGFGDHSPNWSASYGIGDQVQRFKRFIRTLGLQNFHLMGISLGGYLAAYYTAHHPHRVKSLCLMDCAGFSSPVRSDAMRLLESRNRNIFLPTTEQAMQDMVDFLMHCPVQLPVALNRFWVRQVLALLPWRQKLLTDLMDNGMQLMDGLAHQITVPTFVLWGAQDQICHVSAVDKIMEMIGNCRAYIIHGCGHVPIVEYPTLSRKLYMGFLRRISASDAGLQGGS